MIKLVALNSHSNTASISINEDVVQALFMCKQFINYMHRGCSLPLATEYSYDFLLRYTSSVPFYILANLCYC